MGQSIAAVAGITGAIVLVILFVIAQFFRLWLQAYMSNAGVRMTDLIGMYLHKVEMTTVVFAKIQLVKSGIHDMTVNDLESHYLAGGRVGNVTRAMIAANPAVLALDWNKACAIDLAGRDITDAINTRVNQKVIDAPDLEPGEVVHRRRGDGRGPAQSQGPRHGPHRSKGNEMSHVETQRWGGVPPYVGRHAKRTGIENILIVWFG